LHKGNPNGRQDTLVKVVQLSESSGVPRKKKLLKKIHSKMKENYERACNYRVQDQPSG